MVDVKSLMRGFFRQMLRFVLWLMGLVFLLSLLAAGLLWLGLWLLRALWFKLSGRPVSPMAWQFLRQSNWSGFGRSRQERRAAQSEVIDVTARTVEGNRQP